MGNDWKIKPILGGESPKGGDSKGQGIFSDFPGFTPKTSAEPWNTFDGIDALCKLSVKIRGGSVRETKVLNDIKSRDGDEAAKLVTHLLKNKYIDFLVQHVTKGYSEVAQIVPVTTDNYAGYAHGSQPLILNVGATLLNTVQDDQATAFEIIYNSLLRASRLARYRGYINFETPFNAYTGVILGARLNESAAMSTALTLNFDFLVATHSVEHRVTRNPTPYASFEIRDEGAKRLLQQIRDADNSLLADPQLS